MKAIAGKNFQDVSSDNRSLLVRLILQNPGTTRAQLSRITSLSRAAITKIVNVLMDEGVVYETHFVRGQDNRRAIGLGFSIDSYQVLGIKVARQNFDIGLFSFDGTQIEKERFYYKGANAQEIISRIKEQMNRYLDRYQQVVAIGVSVPGPFNMKDGKIILMTEVEGFENISIQDELSEDIDVPVIIGHDANAAALACTKYLDQGRRDNLAYYLLGQGIGLGVADHGKLILGNLGTACEIGHVSIDMNGRQCNCGNRGCLEVYCSSLAFMQAVEEGRKAHLDSLLNHIEDLDVQSVMEAAETGDQLAVKLLEKEAEYIALGAITIINLFSPETVVFGDEMAVLEPYIRRAIDRIVKPRVLPGLFNETEFVFANDDRDYVLLGAATLAVEYCLDDIDMLAR